MRLFIAAPVTPSAALSEATTSLQDLFPGSRPVSGGSRHITLRFLGEVEKAQPVAAALRNALFGTAPVPAEVRGVGAFPQADAARIAWAAVDAPALDALVTRIWNATGKYGNRPEHSGFIPHITLARCRQARNITSWIDQYENTVFFQGHLEHVILFSSKLTPSGAVYTAESVEKLGPDSR